MKPLAIFLFFLGLGVSDPARGQYSIRNTDIIFSRTTHSLKKNRTVDTSNLTICRSKIEELMCLVEPPNENYPDIRDRPCLSGGKKFSSYFEGHFDRSNDLIKKMYCRLDHIWVEKNFVGTAFASPLIDSEGQVISGGIGIREEVLNFDNTFDDWLSWKEETSFGGATSITEPRLGILQYVSNHNSKDFFLDYVLNHEFGHLFDFANKLNQLFDCNYEETSPGHWEPVGDCRPIPGSWGEISWVDIQTPKPSADFEFRANVCFYFCNGEFISHSHALALFSGLLRSPFVSTYASIHPAEDWAETFALFLAHNERTFSYALEVENKDFNMTEHFLGSPLKSKRTFIENFLKGKVIYPGD